MVPAACCLLGTPPCRLDACVGDAALTSWELHAYLDIPCVLTAASLEKQTPDMVPEKHEAVSTKSDK